MTTIFEMGLNSKSVGVHRTFTPKSYGNLLKFFIDNGETVSPNGVETKEIIDATLILRHANDRIIVDRGRNMNIAFAIAEWISYVCGIDDIEYFKQFISTYDRFSTNGKTLDGAYGTRIIHANESQRLLGMNQSQVDGVVKELSRDPYSRRAIISIFNTYDLYGGGGKNTPCTLNLQFFIRNELLHLKTNMRSCDVVKGLTYDMFTFTMIQELIARQLDIETGFYLHNAGSFHLYKDDYDLIDKLEKPAWRHRMNKMPKLEFQHLQTLKETVEIIQHDYQFIEAVNEFPEEPEFFYMKDLLLTMKAFISRNANQNVSKSSFLAIEDQTIKYVLRPWLVRAGVM